MPAGGRPGHQPRAARLPGEAVLGVPPLSDDDASSCSSIAPGSCSPRSHSTRPPRRPSARSRRTWTGSRWRWSSPRRGCARSPPSRWRRAWTTGSRCWFAVPAARSGGSCTLAGSIDWSHALLDDADRVVLPPALRVRRHVRAAPRPGASARDGDRRVTAAEVLPALGRLVDKSLVVAEERDGESRYRLLETIRAYATARLRVEAEERSRCASATSLVPALARPPSWIGSGTPTGGGARSALEYDNLRAAWSTGSPPTIRHAGRRLAASLAWFWHFDRARPRRARLPAAGDRTRARRSAPCCRRGC